MPAPPPTPGPGQIDRAQSQKDRNGSDDLAINDEASVLSGAKPLGQLVAAGILRQHLHFGGPSQELGPNSKVNIDILWTKGKVAVEFKRTIKSLTSPGRSPAPGVSDAF
jgi:hypothetical protein